MSACARPLDVAALTDYWLDDLPEPDLARIEEHLFECGACSERLRALASLGDGVRRLARQGGVEVLVTPEFLEAASRQGLRTREYRLGPGDRVACTITPEDDLVVARLAADFRGVSRVDVILALEGAPEERVQDLPIPADAAELIVLQSSPFLRGLQHEVMTMRLVVPGERERLLGEYTFAHYPTPKG